MEIEDELRLSEIMTTNEAGPNSMKELEEQIKNNQTEIKEKYSEMWKQDRRAGKYINRGWCDEHRNWCPVKSEYNPPDPLTQFNHEQFQMYRNDGFLHCTKTSVVKETEAEKKICGNTWQGSVLISLHKDMKAFERGNIWPYTSYSTHSSTPSLPGDLVDMSPEEMRFEIYELKKKGQENNYIYYEKTLKDDYENMRGQLKMTT